MAGSRSAVRDVAQKSNLMSALSIRQLTKRYPNGVEALRGIDLTVERGDFYALLGPNGAGKTTTIGIVTSLVTKTSGSVAVFGHDIDRARELAKAELGLVPQEINLNLFEKIETIVVNQGGYYGLPRRLAKQRAEQYLKELKLWERRHDIARTLSGGMKRRLMIARALVHEPRLLILDEPTAGVDIEIRRTMWDFLREINERGTTIILTTHYLEEAESLCRNVGIIDAGQIVVDSPMKDVLRKLQRETFVLSPREPLTAVPSIDGYELALRKDGDVEISVDKSTSLNAVFAALNGHGVDIVSMRPQIEPAGGDVHRPCREPRCGGSAGMNTWQVNWVGFKTIVHKEIYRVLRIWVQTLVPPAITMTLYFIIFGSLIGSRIGEMGGYTYMQFIAPGLIMMSVITNSYGNVVSSFFGAKFARHIEEMLVSPLSNATIILGHVVGGVIRGLGVGVVVADYRVVFYRP